MHMSDAVPQLTVLTDAQTHRQKAVVRSMLSLAEAAWSVQQKSTCFRWDACPEEAVAPRLLQLMLLTPDRAGLSSLPAFLFPRTEGPCNVSSSHHICSKYSSYTAVVQLLRLKGYSSCSATVSTHGPEPTQASTP